MLMGHVGSGKSDLKKSLLGTKLEGGNAVGPDADEEKSIDISRVTWEVRSYLKEYQ